MYKMVSVIVLSYKNIDGIFDTLDSIFFQDYPNIEIIISDDGSPNFGAYINKIDSYIKDKKRENITNFIINAIEKNGGTVKNVNSAIKLSSGDYIKLIAAEDMFSKADALSTMVSFLENSDFEISFAKIRGVTSDGEYKYELLSFDSDFEGLKKYTVEQTKERLYKRNFLPAPGAFFSRKLFQKYGLFPEEIRLIEDYPFWIYLCMKTVRFGYIDDVLIDCKMTGVSSAGSYSEMFMKDMFIIYDQYIFPYDKRFGIFQPIYNMLKRGGLNFYMAEAQREKMNTKQKAISRIKYLPFYILVNTQKLINSFKG